MMEKDGLWVNKIHGPEMTVWVIIGLIVQFEITNKKIVRMTIISLTEKSSNENKVFI